MAYRILLLESTRDHVAALREARLQNDPLLREHQFDFFYAAEPDSLEKTQPLPIRLARSNQKTFDDHGLLQRLTERLELRPADILLVRSGSLFLNFPEQVWSMLNAVKTAFPRLRIGFHPRPFERQLPKACVEYTTEMHDLMQQVFTEPRKR